MSALGKPPFSLTADVSYGQPLTKKEYESVKQLRNSIFEKATISLYMNYIFVTHADGAAYEEIKLSS